MMSAVKATVGARQVDPNQSLAERYHECPIEEYDDVALSSESESDAYPSDDTEFSSASEGTLMRGLQHVASSYVLGTSMGECT